MGAALFQTLAVLLALTLYAVIVGRAVLHYLHMLQLNSYRNERYLRWLNEDLLKRIGPVSLLPLVSLLFYWNSGLFFGIWIGGFLLLSLKRPKVPVKKPLVVTGRVKRLMAATFLIWLGASLLALFLGATGLSPIPYFSLFLMLGLLLLLLPWLLVVANLLAVPVESAIAKWYIGDAGKIINGMPGLQVVGITGSYGKTSTKFILNELLLSKYNALMTPGSFNTLLGVTRIIREKLKPIHDLFLVEMGAKQPGDIREICELVHPRYGLITTIGKQHLEMFKSLANIVKTKSELVEFLPSDGIAFLNADDESFAEVRGRTQAKVVSFGVDSPGADYAAREIKYLANGLTALTLSLPSGETLLLETRLLGKNNIYNIVSAVAVAMELGVPENRIKATVRSLQPAPHRLNVKKSAAGITIVDDAFSSNPMGARAALDVLREIEGNRKVLITPGMVELGETEAEENRLLGAYAASRCDYAILVGIEQAKPIYEGLVSEGYPENQIYIAAHLNEANDHFAKISREGDVVLYENDLPDTYN
ncbi:MAG: UDP-N-acetylmuramoyl-tripeptide--D-alanyl-D-alanine ligase [gamma proteobacterium endosymbiont of Lamellibrachia anaximandri]|nr:UDP-N-acetylmuramoyl-tripeptide--D-alanyl-D-alanine ligase [gamma proteobacterium endosymbiont of Lamellibrachia anaximandri]MBL3616479.1 UDP-N-acetylmuramoyl-tripeptide--D-alanyl-D-alanine ligase [gamma proteobacterium endosymbiont of Lamellibrachia anaximandri]